MAVNLAPPQDRTPQQWSTRTSDLDGATRDLVGRDGQLGDRTEDIFAQHTDDVANEREPVHGVALAPPRAGNVADAPPVTLDLGRSATEDMSRTPAAATDSGPSPAATAAFDTVAVAASNEPPPVAASEAVPEELTAGTILAERYLIEATLGSGGTAIVYRARDLQSADRNAPRARVAIKMPRMDGEQRRSRAAGRLQHEFRHAQKLSHPNIVQVFGLHAETTPAFMTMELVEGASLATLLQDSRRLSAAMQQSILRSCAAALSYAHAHQIVHGDFKPANVLVTSSGAAKVFDFGASGKTAGSSDTTGGTAEDTRIPAGTPAYASPQILSGEEPDCRDDVFSFACVAYEVLTGQHPFERRSSLEAREQGLVPARAWNLMAPQWLALLSALSWEREQRPTSIDALIAALLPERAVKHAAPPLLDAPYAGEQLVDRATAGAQGRDDLAEAIIAPQRGWGFFAFVAVAVSVVTVLYLHDDDNDVAQFAPSPPVAVPAPSSAGESLMGSAPLTPRATPASIDLAQPTTAPPLTASTPLDADEPDMLPPGALTTEPQAVPVSRPPPAKSAPTAVSSIEFETDSVVTSESAIAAVFIMRRSPPLAGRTVVHWRALDGTAKAGEDFIGVSGKVEFGDGQAQRAIYIPLRNDTIAEGDERFTLEITSVSRGRIGATSKVEATIRDDD